ncbi:MAG: YqeG family HAD IIIA-type phosphatase [Clostridia bacterium]|nr:YqeG family HAD IIIA-type phosphatase [Clostridia bacterium]
MRLFTPDLYYNRISDIPISILKDRGIRAIICDLDNTLDCHETPTPSDTALAFLSDLKQAGFDVCIISNGKQPRVDRYVQGLSIPYIAKAGKPAKRSYTKALKAVKCKPKAAAFIGDQIFTDIWGANRVGLTSILVEPIKSIENPFFYPKRLLEKFVKANLTKEG